MLNWFIENFYPEKRPVTILPENQLETRGENMLYTYDDNRATIRQMKNGKFRLLVNGNEVVATYSRRRDALRGAARRGLSLA